jgi:phospholipid N-methyltransferase
MSLKAVSDAWLFGKEWWRNKAAVGTPFACSQKTAERITMMIEDRSKNTSDSTTLGRRILETGAGTGVFTAEIVRKMDAKDELVVVECGRDFCAKLRGIYRSDARISIFEGTIQSYKTYALSLCSQSQSVESQFDHVVGAVPMTSLPTEAVVKEVFQAHVDLIRSKGTYSQVEYVGTSTLRKCWAWVSGNEEASRVIEAKNLFYQTHGKSQEIVWQNLPPARVHHMQF